MEIAKPSEKDLFKAWLKFFAVSLCGCAIAGGIGGAVVGIIVGFVLGAQGHPEAIQQTVAWPAKIVGFLIALPVSYVTYRWSVKSLLDL